PPKRAGAARPERPAALFQSLWPRLRCGFVRRPHGRLVRFAVRCFRPLFQRPPACAWMRGRLDRLCPAVGTVRLEGRPFVAAPPLIVLAAGSLRLEGRPFVMGLHLIALAAGTLLPGGRPFWRVGGSFRRLLLNRGL